MGKRTKLKDRSLRVIDVVDEFDAPGAAVRIEKVLTKARISRARHEQVVSDINLSVQFYKSAIITEPQRPRPGQQRAELLELRRRADALKEACLLLSPDSRLRILDALPSNSVDTFKLQAVMSDLSRSATLASRAVPRERGGLLEDLPLRNLLHGIYFAWLDGGGTGKGVTKSGDTYSGPVVDVAQAVLSLTGIRPRSKDSIGRKLYALRNDAAKFHQEHGRSGRGKSQSE